MAAIQVLGHIKTATIPTYPDGFHQLYLGFSSNSVSALYLEGLKLIAAGWEQITECQKAEETSKKHGTLKILDVGIGISLGTRKEHVSGLDHICTTVTILGL